MTVALATVCHDPRGHLLGKLEEHLPGLSSVFDGIGVMVSEVALPESVEVFRAAGAVVDFDDGPPGTDTIGRRRRESLAVALRTGATHVVYADVDHAMRWLERNPDDLRAALASLGDADFTIIGRPPDVFAEAPASLRETEGLCNRFYEQLTGRRSLPLGKGFARLPASHDWRRVRPDARQVARRGARPPCSEAERVASHGARTAAELRRPQMTSATPVRGRCASTWPSR